MPLTTIDTFAIGVFGIAFTYDGKHFLIVEQNTQNLHIYSADFTLIRTVVLGFLAGATGGMAFDGKDLWISDLVAAQQIHKFDLDGNLIKSWAAPTISCYGMIFDDKYLWVYQNVLPRSVYCLDLDGNVITSFPVAVGINARGMAFDGKILWVGDFTAPTSFQGYTRDGVLIKTELLPATPYGACFDGKYIYASHSATATVYKMQIT